MNREFEQGGAEQIAAPDSKTPGTTKSEQDNAKTLSRWIIGHFVQQGAMRGFLYGAGVGVFLWVIGALFGCIIGGVAGALIGLLDGLVLAAIARHYERERRSIEDFIAMASWRMPLLTFCAVFAICLAIAIPCSQGNAGDVDPQALSICLLIGLVPSAIAAFAAWQSVQKMWDWYIQR